jgi:hypothetical protein
MLTTLSLFTVASQYYPSLPFLSGWCALMVILQEFFLINDVCFHSFIAFMVVIDYLVLFLVIFMAFKLRPIDGQRGGYSCTVAPLSSTIRARRV